MKIILGSRSKYRKAILEEMGYEFAVMASDIDEKAIRLDDPEALTLALANAKADVLAAKIEGAAILITTDSVIICNGEIREKPRNADEAKKFLKDYNTHPAENIAAVVVTNLATGKRVNGIDRATIYFKPFFDNEIEEMVATGEVFAIAGGFSPRKEFWTEHIEKIEGTMDSFIGLPKALTQKLINEVS